MLCGPLGPDAAGKLPRNPHEFPTATTAAGFPLFIALHCNDRRRLCVHYFHRNDRRWLGVFLRFQLLAPQRPSPV